MEYALYKGEDLLEIGTLEEIAKAQNIKIETVKFYKVRSYLKRLKNNSKKGFNAKVLIALD